MRRVVWPAAVAGAVVAAAVVYTLLGRRLEGPSVFGDEMIYMDAARALAGFDPPTIRDEPYGFGPIYPLLLAPVLALAPGEPAGYDLVKAVNAVLFALAAIPVYLLGRRLLPAAWSFAVALLSIAAPSALYTGFVLTEGLSYLLACSALLGIALVLERPTIGRQLGAVAVIGLSVATRAQLVALAATLVLGLAVRWLSLARPRPGMASLVRLWPTGAVLAAGLVLAVAVPVARGTSPLRGYEVLWRSYDPLVVLKMSWYSLAGLELYLAFVPVVIAPAALVLLLRPEGSTPRAAFASVFVAANAAFILLVGAFLTTPLIEPNLHDRYLFYVVPLWLVLTAAWLELGATGSRKALAAGAVLGVVLAATLPTRLLIEDRGRQLDGVATALWAELQSLTESPGDVRAALVLAAAAAVAVVLLVPVRVAGVLLAPIAAVFVLNAVFVWQSRYSENLDVFDPRTSAEVSWVDRAAPKGDEVTTLYVASGACLQGVRDAFLWTEFYNERIGPGAGVGGGASGALPTTLVLVGADGTLRTSDGRPLSARYVVTPPGVALDGRLLARGTTSALGLWAVDGRVRVVGARSDEELLTAACAPA